jgi:hypothetical protein
MEFDGSGLIRLTGAVRDHDVTGMRDRIWDFLAERGIDRDDPATWPAGKPPKLQALHRSGVFAPMASAPVCAALDALLGTWQTPKVWGLPLVTFPEPGEWAVPRTGWHVDAWGARPGVTVFVFPAPVAPKGGGTLVLAGSHPIVARELAAGAKPADIKASLAERDRWLRDVWSGGYRSAEGETELDGHRIRLVELTGAAGDAILMHPATLHAPAPNAVASSAAAPNAQGTPRLMLVEIVAGATQG